MTSNEEREKRRDKRKRDAIARDLHSTKYRQRKMPKRRKGGKHDRQTDEDLLHDGLERMADLHDYSDWE